VSFLTQVSRSRFSDSTLRARSPCSVAESSAHRFPPATGAPLEAQQGGFGKHSILAGACQGSGFDRQGKCRSSAADRSCQRVDRQSRNRQSLPVPLAVPARWPAVLVACTVQEVVQPDARRSVRMSVTSLLWTACITLLPEFSGVQVQSPPGIRVPVRRSQVLPPCEF
jgi:hypothetical protein